MKVFVDTNVLLHNQHYASLPWREFLKTNEVTLVIAPCIWRNLDKVKIEGKHEHIRNRARNITSSLVNHIENNQGQVNSCTRIVALLRSPLSSQDIRFSRDVDDDELIATIVEYMNENKKDSVVFITNDYLLRAKSKEHDITVLKLPDEYEISAPVNEEKKLIKELELEIATLKEQNTKTTFIIQ